MNKSISLVLVAMLALSVLVVGCTGSDAAPTTDGTQTGSVAQEGADAAIDDAVLTEGDDVQIGELVE